MATGYSGTVHFTSTDGQAVLPADATLAYGVGTFSETLKTAGNQTITAMDTTTSSIKGQSKSDDVSPGAATHLAISLPSSDTAGTADNFTVTALDAFGNLATGYSGTVHFTSTDGQAVLPADTTLANGVGTFSETFKTAGTQTITGTDTANSSVSGQSGSDTVVPGAVTHFTVSLPASETAGTSDVFTVTALDAFDNLATGYSGMVHFTSTDGAAVLPADITLANGTGSFSETFETAGSQTLTANDTANANIAGHATAAVAAPSTGGGPPTTLGDLDPTSQLVERLYFALLDRPADASGLANFDALYNAHPNTTGLRRIAYDITISTEYHGLHPGLTDSQFVQALYEGALGRPTESSALHHDVHDLHIGLTRQALAVAVAESQEAISHLAGKAV